MKPSRASCAGPRVSDAAEGRKSGVAAGRTWAAPALRRLAASAAEISPNVNVDAEGHS